MAGQNDSNEKTLEPTEKRLQDARKKGDVPSSKETGNMVVVLALLGIVAFVLPFQTPRVVGGLSALIEQSATLQVGHGAPGVARLSEILGGFSYGIALAVAPVFALLALGGAFGAAIQGEIVLSFERIKPKLSKVSPMEGFKRLFSANTLVEFVKSIIKVLAVGALAIWVSYGAVTGLWTTVGFLPEHLGGYLVGASRKLLMAAAALLVPIAIADILWRRFDWRRKQRMSHKEQRDEMKEMEGSPELRGARARRRRELSRQRTIAVVPLADVILTNPTHYAIALKYDPTVDEAPICIAKGADLVALKIREIGFANEIPVIENKPLTRLLYQAVEVDQVVPVAHWEIVAEIISYVFDLKQRKRRAPPAGSTLLEGA
jgi:flagellar biosynthetic protein FlhB